MDDLKRGKNKHGKERLLDVRSDVVFKKIFGQHPSLTKSFLNSVMPLPNNCLIDTVEYLPSEQVPRIPDFKNTIVDVKCKDKDGRIFIVEIQLNWTDSFFKRFLFGISKAFVQQLELGQGYHELSPVYGLALLNASFDNNSEEWFHHYILANKKDIDQTLEGLELIFLEFQKFKPQTLEHKKMAVLWLRFLKEINGNIDSNSIPKDFLENPELSQAVELAKESMYTPEELARYDIFLDAVRTEKTIQADAAAKGKAEGKAEGKKEVAIEMLQVGMQVDKVVKFTGLSVAEAEKLKTELENNPEGT